MTITVRLNRFAYKGKIYRIIGQKGNILKVKNGKEEFLFDKKKEKLQKI